MTKVGVGWPWGPREVGGDISASLPLRPAETQGDRKSQPGLSACWWPKLAKLTGHARLWGQQTGNLTLLSELLPEPLSKVTLKQQLWVSGGKGKVLGQRPLGEGHSSEGCAKDG